jgi:serine/threonine protein kinase
MPTLTSVDEFLNVVIRSQVVGRHRLATWLRRGGESCTTLEQLASRLMVDGLLTSFQIENLLQGKCRGYFIGPWKVLGRIGSGKTSVVYLCQHRRLRRRVAIKVLLGIRARDETALGRFEREARAAVALDHPNIVHAFEVGWDDGIHYLVMEYINGVSLRRFVADKGPLSPIQAAHYLEQAARGLHHAHQAGLVHRDIRPSNLMIDDAGVLKILDLGLARFDEDDIDLTGGGVLGSGPYIAPEQATDSHEVDARADIYSLGATFYLCLTGKLPRPGTFDPLPRSRCPAEAPEFTELMRILRQMMAVSPGDRYQSAAEVAETIADWRQPWVLPVFEPLETPADLVEPCREQVGDSHEATPVLTEDRHPTPSPTPSPLRAESGDTLGWLLIGAAVCFVFAVVLTIIFCQGKAEPVRPIPGYAPGASR